MTLHFLHDVGYDAESTQKSKNYAIVTSLKREIIGKLINRIPGLHLLISSSPGFLFIVTPIVGVCNCSMFCCTLLYVDSSIEIILMGKRELIALLNLSSWCLVMVEQLFLAVPRGCLQFVIVVFPDHTHLLFWV